MESQRKARSRLAILEAARQLQRFGQPAATKATHYCLFCGDTFTADVPPDLVHCEICHHHYSLSRETCGNCHTLLAGCRGLRRIPNSIRPKGI